MATKKNTTSKKNDKPSEPRKRTEILRADLVKHALGHHDLPTDGAVEEQAERLEAYFRAEYQKQAESKDESVRKAADILVCEPPEDDQSTGCRFKSLPAWAFCPFCGQAEDVAGREALAQVEKMLAPIAAEATLAPRPGEVIVTSAAEIKAKRERKKRESKPPTDAPAVDEKKSETTETPREENAAKKPSDRPSAALVSSASADLDVQTAEPDRGFTVAYLDVLEKRVIDACARRRVTEVETFFAEGEALKEIRDKNLFALILNADGRPVFPNFGSYAMSKFDYSHGHASKLIRIVEWVPKEIALGLGVAKASLLAADGMSAELRSTLLPLAPSLTVRQLEEKIRMLTQPEPASPALSDVGAPKGADYDEDGVYREEEPSDDAEDDGDEKPPRSERGEAEESDAELLRPKTVAVTLADEEHVIELMVAGSNVKPAKKISDGGHAEIATIGGHKMRFDLRIGEGGGLEIVMKVRRPG